MLSHCICICIGRYIPVWLYIPPSFISPILVILRSVRVGLHSLQHASHSPLPTPIPAATLPDVLRAPRHRGTMPGPCQERCFPGSSDWAFIFGQRALWPGRQQMPVCWIPKEAAVPSSSPEEARWLFLWISLPLSASPSVFLLVSLSLSLPTMRQRRQTPLVPPSFYTSASQASVVYSRSRGSQAASSASRLQSPCISLHKRGHQPQGEERGRMRAQGSWQS